MRSARSTVAAVALLVVATGCADYVGDDIRAGDFARRQSIELRDVATPIVDPPPPPEPVDPVTLDPGACFDDLSEPPLRAFGRGETVGRIACAYPHRYEVYARVALADPAGEPWPGDVSAEERSDRACVDAFESFVGTPWADSSLDYLYLPPSQPRWDAGDTRVSCALFDLGLVPLVGSMEQRER